MLCGHIQRQPHPGGSRTQQSTSIRQAARAHKVPYVAKKSMMRGRSRSWISTSSCSPVILCICACGMLCADHFDMSPPAVIQHAGP